MDLKEVVYGVGKWMKLPQNRVEWCDLAVEPSGSGCAKFLFIKSSSLSFR
jgi:hypothetical protein